MRKVMSVIALFLVTILSSAQQKATIKESP